MATTTIHVPEELLADIDRAAEAAGISRNRFVIQACRDAMERHGGDWPAKFFQDDLPASDKELINEGTRDLEREIRAARRSRGAVAL
jgi:hypothetical protein